MLKNFKIFGKNGSVELRDDADMSVFEEIFVDRDYRVVDEVIGKAKKIVDIGGHAGLFTLYAKLLNPQAEVFVFEPVLENFSLLKENLKANRVKGVVAKNLAVAAADGVREIGLNSDSHNHSFYREGASTASVSCISLNTIFERYELEMVDLVKMDCEGAEFEIIENLADRYFSRVKTFYVEFHEYQVGMRRERLVNFLKQMNFNCKVFNSHYDKRMGFILAQNLI